jgi:hypothetical protein
MQKYLRVIVVGAMLGLLNLVLGCTVAKISGTSEIPLILNQPQAKIETIQKFEYSKHIAFDYTSAFDVSEVLNKVMIGSDADAIINLRITVETNFVDFLLNLFTVWLAQSKHLVVSGTAIRAPEGLSLLPGEEVETLASSSRIDEFMTFLCQYSPGMDIAIIPNSSQEKSESYRLVRYKEQP